MKVQACSIIVSYKLVSFCKTEPQQLKEKIPQLRSFKISFFVSSCEVDVGGNTQACLNCKNNGHNLRLQIL